MKYGKMKFARVLPAPSVPFRRTVRQKHGRSCLKHQERRRSKKKFVLVRSQASGTNRENSVLITTRKHEATINEKYKRKMLKIKT